MSQENLQIRWIRLSDAVNLLLENNPKLHDIGGLVQSLQRYGLQELPLYDSTLSNVAGGVGAIKAGNGRIEALYAMLKQGLPAPAGVKVDDNGEWLIPVIYGTDADNMYQALGYVIDGNNLVMTGGDFTAHDMSKLWDNDNYQVMLRTLLSEGLDTISMPLDVLDNFLLLSAGEHAGGAIESKESITIYRVTLEFYDKDKATEAAEKIRELGYVTVDVEKLTR